MEASIFNETFNLPTDTGNDSQFGRLLALLDAMQEAAGRHAEKLGVGVRELHGKGLTWVLARLHVKVNQVPGAGQSMHIATWPSGRHRLFAVRDFRLSDNTGMEILRATSAWALMNMETRRLARLDPHLPVFSRCPERMIADDFLALPLPQRADHTAAFRAVAADIDINNHVNNLVYMDWALRAVAAETSRQKLLSLEAAFLGEARLDDEIICRSESTVRDGITIVRQSLRDALSSRELTRLCWTFEKPAT